MIMYVIIIIIVIKFVCAFFEYARDVFVWGIEVFYSILCVIQIFFFLPSDTVYFMTFFAFYTHVLGGEKRNGRTHGGGMKNKASAF